MKRNNNFPVIALIAAIIVGVAISAFVCLRHSAPKRPAHLVIGWDTSRGYRPHLPDAATRGGALAAQFDPDSDTATMYRIDCDSHCIYEGPAPESAESAMDTLNCELAPLPKHDGTRPALFFTEVCKHIQADRQDVILILFGDADNDDGSAQAKTALCKAGKALADNPHVRGVVFADVSAGNRDAIERQFGALGSRLRILGITDSTQSALTSICDKALRNR